MLFNSGSAAAAPGDACTVEKKTKTLKQRTAELGLLGYYPENVLKAELFPYLDDAAVFNMFNVCTRLRVLVKDYFSSQLLTTPFPGQETARAAVLKILSQRRLNSEIPKSREAEWSRIQGEWTALSKKLRLARLQCLDQGGNATTLSEYQKFHGLIQAMEDMPDTDYRSFAKLSLRSWFGRAALIAALLGVILFIAGIPLLYYAGYYARLSNQNIWMHAMGFCFEVLAGIMFCFSIMTLTCRSSFTYVQSYQGHPLYFLTDEHRDRLAKLSAQHSKLQKEIDQLHPLNEESRISEVITTLRQVADTLSLEAGDLLREIDDLIRAVQQFAKFYRTGKPDGNMTVGDDAVVPWRRGNQSATGLRSRIGTFFTEHPEYLEEPASAAGVTSGKQFADDDAVDSGAGMMDVTAAAARVGDGYASDSSSDSEDPGRPLIRGR